MERGTPAEPFLILHSPSRQFQLKPPHTLAESPVSDLDSNAARTNAGKRHAAAPRDLVAVLIALVLPTIVTWVYFFQADALPPQLQLTIFSTVKTIQFAFPLFWVLAIQRGRVTLRRRTRKGLNSASRFGAIVAAAIFALYLARATQNSDPVVAATEIVIGKVSGWGIDTPGNTASSASSTA